MTEVNDWTRLRERVRACREAAEMSRKQLARRAGCSVADVRACEEGDGRISLLVLRALADGLGLSLGALLGTRDPALCLVEARLNAMPADTRALVLRIIRFVHDESVDATPKKKRGAARK